MGGRGSRQGALTLGCASTAPAARPGERLLLPPASPAYGRCVWWQGWSGTLGTRLGDISKRHTPFFDILHSPLPFALQIPKSWTLGNTWHRPPGPTPPALGLPRKPQSQGCGPGSLVTALSPGLL